MKNRTAIGFVGGAVIAVVVVLVSNPSNAVEAASLGGKACALGFLAVYLLAGFFVKG